MPMKKIGFLSFGHWTPSRQSQTRSASDALLQSIDLAVAAEELGADGAYFRVHHFARQLGSPFPLLAAVGAKTKRIEIGTALSGGVSCEARLLHGGRTTQVWDAEVKSEVSGKTIALFRCTQMLLSKPRGAQ